jgi:hypothetical protein
MSMNLKYPRIDVDNETILQIARLNFYFESRKASWEMSTMHLSMVAPGKVVFPKLPDRLHDVD